jgi:hypothetical protein
MTLQLSNQAIGALMMALQKGVMEQVDITQILKGFVFAETEDGLVVENPPTFKILEPEQETLDA